MKKSNLIIYLLSLTLLFFSSVSFAQQTCKLPAQATPEITKRYIQCLDDQLNTAKQLQNTWIQKRKFELNKLEFETGNTQILQLFIKSIASNENYIKHSCQWRYSLKLPNALSAAITYKTCELSLVEQFTLDLKRPL